MLLEQLERLVGLGELPFDVLAPERSHVMGGDTSESCDTLGMARKV
jgi:hypothetical protein